MSTAKSHAATGDVRAPQEENTKPHRHLRVVDQDDGGARPRWDRARVAVVTLAAAASSLFALSFFLPWWTFKLYAPQYPGGLTLVISLTGMGGDVHEIDLLNHYIGMAHLAQAAPVERRLAGWGVAAIAIVTLAALVVAGKKLNKLVAVPAILFPLVFLADSVGWLWSFGHHLDPKAPIHLGAFTPEMFGNGKIGQFETFAQPSAGFWIALAAVACAIGAAVVRSRVCGACVHREACKLACPRLMILPDRSAAKKEPT